MVEKKAMSTGAVRGRREHTKMGCMPGSIKLEGGGLMHTAPHPPSHPPHLTQTQAIHTEGSLAVLSRGPEAP